MSFGDCLNLELTIVSDRTDCDSEWELFGKVCYRSFKLNLTWLEARDFCLSVRPGAHLAEILNEDQQVFLANMTNGTQAWIGANDIEEEGNFTWVGSGKPLDYTEWGKIWGYQAPDNLGNEDCVYMSDSNSTWNDFPCCANLWNLVTSVLCQYNVTSEQQVTTTRTKTTKTKADNSLGNGLDFDLVSFAIGGGVGIGVTLLVMVVVIMMMKGLASKKQSNESYPREQKCHNKHRSRSGYVNGHRPSKLSF